MNEFLAPHFVERIDRLALGIEPVDALRRSRIAQPVEMALDGVPYPSRNGDTWDRVFGLPDAIGGLARIPRHNSCRHALLFKPGLKAPVVIRLYDRKRRYAPRRISYPIPADIHTASPPSRVRRPALYPGAAYAVSETATGMRGRVTWGKNDELPVRWARIEAKVGAQVVGRAHGDDRGEFLLLLDSSAVGIKGLSVPLVAQVTVYGPPLPTSPSADDPLADLPVETLLADPDDISAGEKLPPNYHSTASSSRQVVFQLGVLLTRQDKFFFNP